MNSFLDASSTFGESYLTVVMTRQGKAIVCNAAAKQRLPLSFITDAARLQCFDPVRKAIRMVSDEGKVFYVDTELFRRTVRFMLTLGQFLEERSSVLAS